MYNLLVWFWANRIDVGWVASFAVFMIGVSAIVTAPFWIGDWEGSSAPRKSKKALF